LPAGLSLRSASQDRHDLDMELALLLIPLVLAALVFWIWMVIECATKEPDTGNTKIVWIIVIVFMQIIGALIYFFDRRPQRRWEETEAAIRERNAKGRA
jgi:hypothetical protein